AVARRSLGFRHFQTGHSALELPLIQVVPVVRQLAQPALAALVPVRVEPLAVETRVTPEVLALSAMKLILVPPAPLGQFL
ncbi:MAG: hypothetical protein M0Z50_05000, partial [Planctomycetia bacterium]|nr:hypothetical protein [Planctomycetia bacterium]